MNNWMFVYAFAVLAILTGWSNHSNAASGSGTPFVGQTCRKSDTDSIKCMMCAVMFEAGHTPADRVAVGRVIITRARSAKFKAYGNTVCKQVWAPGQFVALNKQPKIRSSDAAAVYSAVNKARALGPWAHVGFRSYAGNGRVRIAPGGNYYGKASLDENLGFEQTEQVADIMMDLNYPGASATN